MSVHTPNRPPSLRTPQIGRLEVNGEPFTKPDRIIGFAFGMSTYPDAPNTGMLWVDDLALLGQETAPAAPPPVEDQVGAPEQDEEPETSRELKLPCGTAFALPIFLICTGMLNKKRKYK